MSEKPQESSAAEKNMEPGSSNSAAVAVALTEAKDKPALAEPVAQFLADHRDFLADHRALIAEQRHHLQRQYRQLGLSILNERFSIAFKVLTVFVGIAVAAFLGHLVWSAAHSEGLVIEPFDVPPDLEARGLNGKIVASELLDRLAALQSGTDSQRNPKSYSTYWGNDIKVEIPETRMSLGDLKRFLTDELGRTTRITGEVVRMNQALALTARAGTSGSRTVSGAESDVDGLIDKLAQSLYALTEPYRWGVWLQEHGRGDDAVEVFKDLALHGPAAERPWGYLGWANSLEDTVGYQARLRIMRQVTRQAPEMFIPRQDAAILEDASSQPGQSVRDLRSAAPLLATSSHGGVRPDLVPIVGARVRAFVDLNLGAFHEATPLWSRIVDYGRQGATYSVAAMLARSLIGEHDISAARAALETPDLRGTVIPGANALDRAWAQILIDTAAENWPAVIDAGKLFESVYLRYPGQRSLAFARETPWLAYAHAKLNDFETAESLLAATPTDCYVCLLFHARIAELRGERLRADQVYASAVALQPATPFAESLWGEALLARGETDSAITKLSRAHQKGPQFADPLELWGEALMRRSDYAGAVARFSAAEEFAPRWGRLHVKWGEALLKLERREGAQKQRAIAATLDLSAAERAELMTQGSGSTGSR